jgi:hypothetical protein
MPVYEQSILRQEITLTMSGDTSGPVTIRAAQLCGAQATANTNDPPRRFDTRLAILVRDDLATWQKLNVTAFLVSGIAATVEGITGAPYQDADGSGYLPMIRQPITVLAGDRAQLTDAHRRALDRGLLMTIYTEELFTTPDDEANRAAVRAVARDELNLVGIGVYGPRSAVDKAVRGTRLHG